MDLVDVRDHPDGEALLAQAYRRLMLPAFPHKEELDDPSSWQRALWGEAARNCFHVVVAGDVEAIAVHELYRSSMCGLVSYIAVDPACRGRGLARTLMDRARTDLAADAARLGGDVRAVFGEVRDPVRTSGQADSMAAAARLEVMHRLGAQLVLRDYVQPELRAASHRAYGLMLVDFGQADHGVQATQAGSLPASAVSAFLVELFTVAGVEHPDLDPDLTMMLGRLAGAAQDGKVRLRPLIEP